MDFMISLVGLNHRTASVDARERFALTEFCSPGSWALPPGNGLNEAFILSTCNRVELLGIGSPNAAEIMLEAWANARKANIGELHSYIYKRENLDAVRHVFEVASSLDSMVLGEPQILGQMKSAYRKAVECHATGPILNRIMHTAFFVAKRVRHETAISASAVSISYAAIELAKRIFGALQSHNAMLIGAGEMAELAAMHLMQAGIDSLRVSNRTFEHARQLAERFNGKAIPFEDMKLSFRDVDIVIASTGSSETIIRADDIKAALKARKNRPMFFIDIAVPRDIDPDVNELDNVYLYDIDDLKEVVEENMAARREEAGKARTIIEEEVANFASWLENLRVQPTILDIIRRGEAAAREELARTFRHLGPIGEEQKKAIETMAYALARKLNHDPIMFLKSGGMGASGQIARINITRQLLNLDKEGGKV